MTKIVSTTLIILLGLWIQPVQAYIDPGSGSAIMSAVIGIFVAVGLVIKTYWYKLKSFFTGNKTTSELDADEKAEDNQGQ